MMPARPAAAFVMIQPEFLLELLIVLCDLPATFSDPHQPPQPRVLRQVTEKVSGGILLALGPFHQQPDLRVGWLAFVKPVPGLDSAGVEARLEPAFRAFS